MVTKIQIRNWKRYCSDYTRIPGFERAANDKTSMRYDCHHILEILLGVSKGWLIEHNLYYNQPPCLLQILTVDEHTRIHGRILRGNTSNPAYKNRGERYNIPEDDELYDLYVIKKLLVKDIVKILGICKKSVYNRLNKFQVKQIDTVS